AKPGSWCSCGGRCRRTTSTCCCRYRRIWPGQSGAVVEGEIVAAAAGRVPGTSEEVLGAAPVGAGILLRDGGRGWTRRRFESTSRTSGGTRMKKASKSPRPPSLEPAMSRGFFRRLQPQSDFQSHRNLIYWL